jgi:Mlc titration factor MtfA (ptsG expression regulator)|tara:strand:+ start:13283 stop:14155 length:873 start_codon:yes stop_codon:yes gene_type:complete
MNKNKRFIPWILFFFILLVCVPLLIQNGQTGSAKLLGFIVVVGVSIALMIWRKQTKTLMKYKTRVALNANDRFWLERNIPFYKKLSKSDRVIFADRIGLFLAEVLVTEVDKEVAEKDTCLLVASSAVYAYWNLPFWNYGKLREVLVYPDNYNNEKVISDAGYIQGQVHHGGMMNNTMILSLRALEQGFSNENDSQNVGVHEFAHLLDKVDGSIDGFPAGMDHETRKVWANVIAEEMKDIRQRQSDINPYALTNEAEFFAVLAEYYKEKPGKLKEKHPEIFEVLDGYFKGN